MKAKVYHFGNESRRVRQREKSFFIAVVVAVIIIVIFVRLPSRGTFFLFRRSFRAQNVDVSCVTVMIITVSYLFIAVVVTSLSTAIDHNFYLFIIIRVCGGHVTKSSR
jgi:MFS-type transporter involved in bile tolerance (Atg22 family)